MSAHQQDILHILEQTELFQGIARQDLARLSQEAVYHHYPAGQMIVQYGETGASMYIVIRGDVNIHLPGEDSRRLSLRDISRGEHFGELALFDQQPRSASAQATTDVELLELTRDTLLRTLQQHPEVAIALLQTLSARLRQTDWLLSQRVAKNVETEFEKQLTWQDHLADKVAALNGSWFFIILLLGITVGWMILNSPLLLKAAPFDPYPYVFFNLVLAILVSLQGPLIVMSQNRQAAQDRTHARIDYEINLKNEINIETLLRELGELRMEVNHRLAQLEAQSKSPQTPPYS